MKRNNIFRTFAALVTGCATLAVSCEQHGPENTVEPVFPSVVNSTVVPGETVTLTFNANLDWEVSVPENTIKTFWIEDGAMGVMKVSGKAGDGNTVVIGTTSSEDFDGRSCSVSMTMGGKTQEIAVISILSAERTIAVYAAEVIDGEIQYADEGGYLYGEEEAETLALYWSGSDFRLPVKVDANYSWTFEGPAWIDIDVPQDRIGSVNVLLSGVPSEYPLADEEGVLRFMAGNTVVKEYKVSIPGCQDIFSYAVNMGLSEIVFNYAGRIKTAAGFVDGPASATVTGTSGTKVFAVGMKDGKFDPADSAGPSWLLIEETEYDDSEGADVLQARNVTISVEMNEGDDRQAVIFFMPPSGPAGSEDLFNDDMTAVKDEYLQYALPVTQLSSNQEFIMMFSSPSEMAANGAVFNVSEDTELFTKFGETKYAYDLVYTDQYASDYARMIFSSPVSSFKVFDRNGTDMTDAEGFFLSVSLDDAKEGGVILMAAEEASSGYVVFYGASGNVLAAVKCTLDPDKVIGDVADVAFIGESAMYAPMVGATLEHLTEGPLYDRYVKDCPSIYHLTYTMAAMPMTISLPMEIQSYMVNPYMNRDWFMVNGIEYDSTDPPGSFERIDGGVQIYMNLPEDKTYGQGAIYFYNVKNAGAASNEQLVLILVCTMDLNGDAE